MSNLAIRSFASGELAPALYARTDLARYENGLRTCRNYLVLRQGGVTKRPGTEFLGAVKDSTKVVRLMPFVFNVRQSFVLEFGHEYVRFFSGGAIVTDPDDPTTPLEIESPYAATDLAGLQYVQSGDVVTIVHPSYPPYELKRLSNTNWTLTPIVFGPAIDAPTGVSVDNLFTLNPNASDISGAYYAVTAIDVNGDESLPAVTDISPYRPTSASGPGAPQRVQGTATGAITYNVYRRDSTGGVYGFVGSGIGETIDFEDWGAIPDLTLQPPIDKSSTLFASEDNYPSVVAYYQQRLIFANTNTAPDSVWCSRTALYHNFNTSAIVQDDDAITFRLVSDEVDAVRHILNLGRLLIGTEGADWIVEGDGNGTLTPIAINSRVGSYDGMAQLKPIKTGARMLFVQAMGSAVRELQSNVQFGTYSLVGDDVTVYSSHLVDGYSIVDWAFQQEPLHVAWAVRSDGVLLALTYIPEQQVLGWSRHDTDGFVEHVCVVPEGRSHWLYLVVRRLINGSYRRYVERMTTTNVTPVFATPEDAAQGSVYTPPPPPDGPPPSTGPIPPPTALSTTDVSPTGATANWATGSALAPTEIGIRVRGGDPNAPYATTMLSGGLTSNEFTALAPNTDYEWRARHVLGAESSAYAGPVPGSQFTTGDAVVPLPTPPSAPHVTRTVSGIDENGAGYTDATISWVAPSDVHQSSRLDIAGPQEQPPTDDDFASVGTFDASTNSALFRVTHTGTYWFRVRYEEAGAEPSAWAGPEPQVIGVADEI